MEMAKYPERQPYYGEYGGLYIPIPDRWPMMTPEQITAWRNEEMPVEADEPITVPAAPG
jgi:hypothetical protein